MAVQVLLFAVLVDAAHSAFEDREEPLDGVACDNAVAFSANGLCRQVYNRLIFDMLTDPRSILYKGGASIRTHPTLPTGVAI